jgi:preprotein translocase subunit YajC
MYINNLILMAPQGAEGGGAGYMNLIFLGSIFIVMYFFMIRPQVKKAKEQRKFIEALKKGDKVITSGGIHGKVSHVNDTTVVVEIDTNAKIEVEKSHVNPITVSGKMEQTKK